MTISKQEKAIYDTLDALGISYEIFRHKKVFTMEECAELDKITGTRHPKNIFLTNRQGNMFYLAMVHADGRFVTKDISKQLGVSRLSFASKEQLWEVLHLEAGAVCPFTLMRAKYVRVLIDKELACMEKLAFHPCTNEATVTISYEDLIKYLGKTQCSIDYIDVE